jgi:hypothetical protein
MGLMLPDQLMSPDMCWLIQLSTRLVTRCERVGLLWLVLCWVPLLFMPF